MLPGDAFSLILLLFLLQHQLDKQLLQLFIAVVDAELFKATAQQRKGVKYYVNIALWKQTQTFNHCTANKTHNKAMYVVIKVKYLYVDKDLWMLFILVEYLVPYKPVVLENLKTVDVQNPDNRVLPVNSGIIVFHLDYVIDTSHNPAEQTLIHGLKTTQHLTLNVCKYDTTWLLSKCFAHGLRAQDSLTHRQGYR